ncbi:hypothetical protein MLP_04370 [Microlunatus phosphovorus NM-1]|uniref:Uncharacterized protein n=1 Tax=Microlunatus phosphovorus (strain ATCC 700054 / DSM 10555 / JCM 9379 / NBRC 101784 / NCIMB 13414 / VKM Ac-1990 / NM-1) TaxID=1032480 RepID=F5XJC5_MICPN|nr:hypothetical protein [Microlunatus phosphovorus]BAK33451.1 hypothetical protein MLP_04370 [Microlunatus phosphovorus NM-1]
MMESIATPPFQSAKSLFRDGRTRRTNSRHGVKPVRGQVDDNTKALRGMLRVQTFTY